MVVLFWIFLCLTTLCCGQGEIFGDASSSIMKKLPLSIRQVHRRFRATESCYDIGGKQVDNGQNYVPSGRDPCLHCKCILGGPEECFTTKCAVPTCQNYKAVPGKCCAYTCPEEAAEKAELAIIISLSVGLVFLLVLLIVVIHRNRKKLRRNREAMQETEEQGEQQGNNNSRDRPLNNQLPTIQEEQDNSFEPPPPYTPARNVNKCKTHHIHHVQAPPNEPPPPYEIQTELRATPV